MKVFSFFLFLRTTFIEETFVCSNLFVIIIHDGRFNHGIKILVLTEKSKKRKRKKERGEKKVGKEEQDP